MKIFKPKIPVGILGATGIVGQKFVELLTNHPWFKIIALTASEKSQGKQYGEAVNWKMASQLNGEIAEMPVQACLPTLPCQVVFSALDSQVAGKIEENFAKKGYIVISNCSPHRMDSNVPLLIPEVNSEHLELVYSQPFSKGMIVTNPNCSVIGLTTALKPLADNFGIEKIHIVTLQSVSGGGYPGVPSLDVLDNVIPFIQNEEEKIETEPLKILGKIKGKKIKFYEMEISAQCNRIAVTEGHIGCVSIKFKNKASFEEIIHHWDTFSSVPQSLGLPTSPINPTIYLTDENHPQPKLHRHLGQGMAVSIGRLRKCSFLEWKFVLLSHNIIRGAAGCAILNAELMVETGYIEKKYS